MYNLKACIACLRTDVKYYNLNLGRLRHEYNLISGLKTKSGSGLPEYLCYECMAHVKNFVKFNEKCQRAYYTLQEILQKNKEVTNAIIEQLDLESLNLKPTLSYLDKGCLNVKYETAKFRWVRQNRLNIESKTDIPALHFSVGIDEEIFDIPELKHEQLINKENSEGHNEATDTDIKAEEVVNEMFDNNFDLNECDNNETDNELSNDIVESTQNVAKSKDDDADGSNLDEEYAKRVPISKDEAMAVVDVYKMFAQGKFQCDKCGKAYYNESRLKLHERMHDKNVSGPYYCTLCGYYYKSEFLLENHITDKHMYKYICRKCPEVSFDRTSAKQHYIWVHLQKGSKKHIANWYDTRGSTKDDKSKKLFIRPERKIRKLPKDFPIYSPISQEEQYTLVKNRQKTKNYIDSPFKCEFCYKGFRLAVTYEKHMKKHDPGLSGKYQCDACKIYCTSPRKMYKHMNMTHLFKYYCQMCNYVCYGRSQAKLHYRWHKNVTYSCPHCNKEFTKASTRLTHIRIKHPSTYICNLCGHSFVSESGLHCHKKLAHTSQEIQEESAEVDTSNPLYCAECGVQFRDDAAFATHFGSSNKHALTNLSIQKVKMRGGSSRRGRPRAHNSGVVNLGLTVPSTCEICNEYLSNDVQARRHYEAEHPGADFLKRYMCDICGHTTKQYANLMVHMRTHTREKPYACPHCERRFSMPSNRDRHLVVHTGEKRYQCQHCSRRFTQSSAVKLHIQTVHLKIPYAPWDKKNRKRKRETELPAAPQPPPLTPKILLDATHGNYLSAYITYNE